MYLSVSMYFVITVIETVLIFFQGLLVPLTRSACFSRWKMLGYANVENRMPVLDEILNVRTRWRRGAEESLVPWQTG